MTTVSAETRINASKAHVWEILSDLGAVARFHPFVSKSYYNSPLKSGVGASRVCEFSPTMAVKETALDWRDGESYVLKVEFVKGPTPPVRDLQGHISVKEVAGGSLARFEMRYQPKFGPIGWLMDQLMIKPQYEKMLAGIVAGLKHHAETGEEVDLSVLKRIQLAVVPG